MEGLLNLTGSRIVEVEVAGQKWRVRPWSMRRYPEMEQYIISLRGPGGPKTNYASLAEVNEFEQSPHGAAWLLWQCLREEHPEIRTIEDAYEWMDAAGKERFEKVMEIVGFAQERDLVKN